MARDATTSASEEKNKNRTADAGDNTGMALLVEAAIVWMHMLKTVLLEQKRRKVVVWVLGLMAKALVYFRRMPYFLNLSAR